MLSHLSSGRERFIRVLRDAPAGLTTEQVAIRLGMKSATASSHLSKLAMHGQIDRTRIKSYSAAGEHRRVYLWEARA